MNITILADSRKEFSVNSNGVVVASMRGVARICDVSQPALSKSLKGGLKPSKLGQMLMDKGFDPADLVKNGFPDTALTIVVEYYTLDAGHYCTEQAKAFYRTFASIGTRTFLKEWLGDDGKKQPNPYGSLVNQGVTCNGHIWRVFWFKNLATQISTLIPVVNVDGNWYLQTRAILNAFKIQKAISVDLTIDLEEFEWMFNGLPIEKHTNFASRERIEGLLKQSGGFESFAFWATNLQVFKIPEDLKAQQTQKVEVKVLEPKTNLSLPPQVNVIDDLNMFHNIAMRLINEVHKASVMNTDLKKSVLEVAFDVLKFTHTTSNIE